jgi:hypothetical protein
LRIIIKIVGNVDQRSHPVDSKNSG